MKRRRYQKGSLRVRKLGGRKVYEVQFYRPDGRRSAHQLGPASEMSKSQARAACDEWMAANVNGGGRHAGARPPLLGEFLEDVFLPFYSQRWKASTRATTEQRIRQHIVAELGKRQFESLNVSALQAFLQAKADAGLSDSIVRHLRFDLASIFELAMAEGVIATDPTPALYTPRVAKLKDTSTMDMEQVMAALEALPQREALICHLAFLAGMRPGEILALQRKHVAGDCISLRVEQRVYAGQIDTPKTPQSNRTVELAPETATLLAQWLQDAVERSPEAYVFSSATGTPLRAGNLIKRIIRPALKNAGIEHFNFQVARRTHASLGHEAGIDPKVAADQRGHLIGTSLDVYTRSGPDVKRKAAGDLAGKVLNIAERRKQA